MITWTTAILAILALVPGAAQAPTAPAKPLGEPLSRFVGEWHGTGGGEPGQGTSQRSYEYVLGGKYLLAKNRSVYPAQEKNPKGETHEDVGYFSYDKSRQRLVLRQFHSEGFVNQYVEEPGQHAGTLVFVSEAIENIPAGWRARESYVFDGPDRFTETFELAEPGKDFTVYSKSTFTRQKYPARN